MILTPKDFATIRANAPNQEIIFCDGVFDLLHAAHIEHLHALKQRGGILVVGVMSDEWVRMKKGEDRPVMPQDERVTLVDAVRYVDYTVLMYDNERHERLRTSDVLKALRPDIFVTTDTSWSERSKEFSECGIEVRVVPRTILANVISTSALIQKIKDPRRS